MGTAAEVTWAKFQDDGAEIVAIGGLRRSFLGSSKWELSADEAIRLIELDEWRFYVDVDDQKHWLDVQKDPDGRTSLRADGAIRTLM